VRDSAVSDDTGLVREFEDALGGAQPTDLADRLRAADSTVRKDCADSLRSTKRVDFAAASPAIEALLAAEDRAVRLTATKAIAESAPARPEAVAALAPSLRERLDDDFYFVRGRAAEALGYVALADPEAIDTTTVLARLLNALSLDRAETRHHVAGALARIALADPRAVRVLTGDIADHLTDDEELVRYHLTTALVAVAAEYPGHCESVTSDIAERLDDDCPQVRGRAAEALGLVGAGEEYAEALEFCSDNDSFVAERVRFALGKAGSPDNIGNLEAIAEATTDIVESITAPDGEGCPHCGETLADGPAPFCPACGAPLQP
jgi:HEAT repeat protein